MGAWIRNNFINISDETRKGVLVGGFSYKDIDDKTSRFKIYYRTTRFKWFNKIKKDCFRWYINKN